MDKYTAAKDQLTRQIVQKQELDARLAKLEDTIYDKETEYFNESMYGNIVKGFDNFAKNSSGSSNKKRLQYTDDDHVFSLSSSTFVRAMMKRQGLGSSSKEDFDDYEDTVEPIQQPPANGTSATSPSNSANTPNSSTPGRKRKARTFDD
ncbi:uncharacterized protein PRCAT00000734001 [Priceomyces carsonii]|uniref:uncharacterized protein n=1 Tax=Priceomyces carsonii TaxID=28549 RepID=UPI002ED8609B|nr:unnamed protein product [Priceomyces carsonii]